MSLNELYELFSTHNRVNGYTCKGQDRNPLEGIILFSQENWNTPYPEISRSYRVSSDNKAFIPGQLGYSIFADCLDGTGCARIERTPLTIEKVWLVIDE